jgi:site-specific recombinase XerD
MTRSQLTLVHALDIVPASLPFSEQLADHHALLQGYLDTHITRNHSQATHENERRFLTGWFENFLVPDEHHPDGERQLLVWEAMEPVRGRQRIMSFSKGLIETGLKPRTVSGYLGILRRLFHYILEYPYLPGDPVQSIVAKYGRIEQPVLDYDYPAHILDQEAEGLVLTGEQLLQFYNFVRMDYIGGNQKKFPASRDYSMIVLAGESGLRADELCHLDALKPHRDLFYEQNCIQTRYGKAAKGSGKRVRKTIFTPLAQATMKVYEDQVRPRFPEAKANPALFLTESGERITYQAAWRNLHIITEAARKAGIEMPYKFSWHDLRRSFATSFMEQHPDQVWLLMDMMGHLNPSTLHRYVRHSRAYYERALNTVATTLTKSSSE